MRQQGRKMEREWWFRKLYYSDPVSQPLVQLWELRCPQCCDIPHLRRWKRSEAVDNRRHSQSLLLLMEMVSFSLSSHNVFIVSEHESCGTNMNPPQIYLMDIFYTEKPSSVISFVLSASEIQNPGFPNTKGFQLSWPSPLPAPAAGGACAPPFSPTRCAPRPRGNHQLWLQFPPISDGNPCFTLHLCLHPSITHAEWP